MKIVLVIQLTENTNARLITSIVLVKFSVDELGLEEKFQSLVENVLMPQKVSLVGRKLAGS